MTIADYLLKLDAKDRQALEAIRKSIKSALPSGFEECIQYNMISFVVPHALYPKGYHCKPKDPLPFISIASQKSHYAIYHMGLYADAELYKWFAEAYSKQVESKMDIGKSCIRIKKNTTPPVELLKKLAGKITPSQWIETYEKMIARKK